MSLVRKVGRPAVRAYPSDSKEVLEGAKNQLLEAAIIQQELQRQLDEERARQPEIVEVEKIVEVEVEKEVVKEVKVSDPSLVQTIADLELENQKIRSDLDGLNHKTSQALQTSHLRILALETTLEQAVKTSERRAKQLKSIKEAASGRWPFMRKKTIRNLL